jgi:hypothetical protein
MVNGRLPFPHREMAPPFAAVRPRGAGPGRQRPGRRRGGGPTMAKKSKKDKKKDKKGKKK